MPSWGALSVALCVALRCVWALVRWRMSAVSQFVVVYHQSVDVMCAYLMRDVCAPQLRVWIVFCGCFVAAHHAAAAPQLYSLPRCPLLPTCI